MERQLTLQRLKEQFCTHQQQRNLSVVTQLEYSLDPNFSKRFCHKVPSDVESRDWQQRNSLAAGQLERSLDPNFLRRFCYKVRSDAEWRDRRPSCFARDATVVGGSHSRLLCTQQYGLRCVGQCRKKLLGLFPSHPQPPRGYLKQDWT